MTASLTTLISTVQGLLLDTGSSYTTATCTAAIRQALKKFNDAAPRFASEQLATVADQNEYELIGGDFGTGPIEVLGVWLADSNGDDDTELDFVDFTEDNRSYIQLKEAQIKGGNLQISFTTPNTINGLDSQATSTIPDYFDQVIANGGAYYAICIRSVNRVENVNINKDVPKVLQASAEQFKADFEDGIRKAGKRKPRMAKADATWTFNPTSF